MQIHTRRHSCTRLRVHLIFGIVTMSCLGLAYAAEPRHPEPTLWERLFGEVVRIRIGEDPPDPDVTPRPGRDFDDLLPSHELPPARDSRLRPPHPGQILPE